MTSVENWRYRTKKRNAAAGALSMQLISPAALLLDAVARAGSFRRAAERLNISASAINRQILKLEEEIGLPLFERLPRGIRPTAAGERLLADIRRWRREQERAEGQLRDLKGQRRGVVSIGAMECFGTTLLPEAIRTLHARNPLIEVEVSIAGAEDLLRKLAAKDIDIALLFNPPHRIAADFLYDLKARPGLVMASNHPLAVAKQLRLSDCLQYGLILPDQSIGIRQVIDAALHEAGVDITSTVTTNSITLMKSLLKLSQQMAVLSIFDVHAELGRGELRFVPIEDRNLEEEILAICIPSNRRPSPAAQAMITILTQSLSSLDPTGTARHVV
jgi:DNA-binding transcriptional LysR family regulator